MSKQPAPGHEPANEPEVVSPRPGRRLALDEGKRREILAILTVGCTRAVAAHYVGCGVATIGRTAERDESFGALLRQAESGLEVRHLQNINNAASDARYWRAAAWALERRFPERWGPRPIKGISPHQLSDVLQRFASIVASEVTDAKIRARLQMRLEALAANPFDTAKPTLDDIAIEAADDATMGSPAPDPLDESYREDA